MLLKCPPVNRTQHPVQTRHPVRSLRLLQAAPTLPATRRAVNPQSVCARALQHPIVGSAGFPHGDSQNTSSSNESAAETVQQLPAHGYSSNESAAETVQQLPAHRYNWESQWYAIVPVGYLYMEKPAPFQLLGLSLVLWNDGRDWVVLEDACSHRLAPLSEGYIQPNGSLMCSYHGWEFDRSGSCTKIPQIGDPKSDKAARCNPRSCVRSFPVQEAWNLIWVWPESGADAWLRASATQPNLPEPVRNPPPNGLRYFSSEKAWSMRETPLDYELLVENILDLSHVPFSHHSIAGHRADAAPSTMSQMGSTSCEQGFVMSTSAPDDGAKRRGFQSGYLQFLPPNMVHYSMRQKGNNLFLTSFTTPCAPGKSRYFSRIYTDNEQATPGWLGWLLMRVPPWMIHLSTHNIVDADCILAAGQQRALRARGISNHLDKAFFCPAIADKAVMVFYKWLSSYSGGRVQYAQPGLDLKSSGSDDAQQPAKPPGDLSREDLLDHWAQHTQFCRFCHEGLTLLDRIYTAAVCVGIGAAVLAVQAATQASPLVAIVATFKLVSARLVQAVIAFFPNFQSAPDVISLAPSALGGWKSILWAATAVMAWFVLQKVSKTKRKFFKGNYTFYDKHLIKMPA